jgi:hypothetical protein
MANVLLNTCDNLHDHISSADVSSYIIGDLIKDEKVLYISFDLITDIGVFEATNVGCYPKEKYKKIIKKSQYCGELRSGEMCFGSKFGEELKECLLYHIDMSIAYNEWPRINYIPIVNENF